LRDANFNGAFEAKFHHADEIRQSGLAWRASTGRKPQGLKPPPMTLATGARSATCIRLRGAVPPYRIFPFLSHPGVSMKKALLAVAISMLVGTAAYADETRYIALVNGGKTQAGHQWVTRDGDGNTRVEFIFKDNGRGPELKEEFKIDKDGTFTSYHVKGTSTFGAAVDET